MYKSMIAFLSLLLLATPAFSMGVQLDGVHQPQGEVGVDMGKTNQSYTDGLIAGEQAASANYSGGGWFWGGLASGLLLGLIGTAIIGAAANSGDVRPSLVQHAQIDDKSGDYRYGFLEGYSKKAKSKRFSAALGGGFLGTAIIVGLILSASSQ